MSLLLFEIRVHGDTNFQTPFDTLTHNKNPCWISRLHHGDPYINHMPSGIPGRDLNEEYKTSMRNIYNNRTSRGMTWRLRCFPYAMIIGVSKSGTTDLFNRITSHPQIFPPAVKEPWFWGRYRMKCKYLVVVVYVLLPYIVVTDLISYGLY